MRLAFSDIPVPHARKGTHTHSTAWHMMEGSSTWPPEMDVRLLAGPTGYAAVCLRRLSRAVVLVAMHVVAHHEDWYCRLVSPCTTAVVHRGAAVVMRTTRRADGTIARRVLLEPSDGLLRVLQWFHAHPLAAVRRLLLEQDGRRELLAHPWGFVLFELDSD